MLIGYLLKIPSKKITKWIESAFITLHIMTRSHFSYFKNNSADKIVTHVKDAVADSQIINDENLSFLSRISQVKGGSTRELIAFWDTLHLRNQSDCSQNLGVPKPNLSRSLDLLSNNPSEQLWLHLPTKTLSKSLENLDACQGNTMQSKEISSSYFAQLF